MYNDLFTIGGITLHGYGLMIGIGILSAYLSAEYRAKKLGLNEELMFPLLIYGAGFGLLGAKLLYYITIWKDIIKDPSLLLNVADGFVVYGGIIGGIAAGYIFCRFKKISFYRYLDLVVPSIALAQGFGRIGCLLAGCCYGIKTNSPFSITFKSSSFAPNGIPLFPSQIVSSALDFIHFFLLCAVAKRTRKPGVVSALYLILYSLGRFIIEFFRGDLIRGAVGGLSTSQFISVFIALLGIVLLIRSLKGLKQP